MPLIVLTASSMRLVIVVSISSALAPGRLACTDTTGASVFGIRSSPSDSYDTAPSTMSAAVIMIAKTGRLTLISAMFMDILRGGRLHVEPHGDPGGELAQVGDRELLIAFQPSGHFHQLVLARTEGDLLLPRLAVFEHVDRRDAGQRGDRVLRDRQHARVDVGEYDSLREETGLELAIAVVHERFDSERARRLIDGRADIRHAALELAVDERLDIEFDRLTGLDDARVLFLNCGLQFERRH